MVEQKNTPRRSRSRSRMANDPLEWTTEAVKPTDELPTENIVPQSPIEEEMTAMHENDIQYVHGLEDLLAAVESGVLTKRMDPNGEDPHCAPMVNKLMDLWEKNQNQLYAILNSISVNIQLADKDYNIIYMNDALQKMFEVNEPEIKKNLPNFNKDQVLGANMDIFHRNPAHQRKMMDALSKPVRSNITLGNSNFNLMASPIFDGEGKRLYTVVEWFDNTALKAINNAFFSISKGDLNIELPPEASCTGSTIDTRRGIVAVRDNLNMLVEDTNLLVNAALDGKLATRADSARHRGEYAKIVDGINRTLDAVINPVNSLSGAIAELSNNNLSVRLEGEFHGDFLDVKNSYENGLDRLNGTLYQIVDAVEEMTQSAIELNAASQNMAASSQEQSSSVEEVTSSLEETDSQVKANTDNANTANQLVVGATETAQLGQKKMENMASAMEAINISAQNISKIIKVIDEIAFQTNLLALNAAVEAARAGQHGRGFAVVAQEVRNLAGRSAKAARETADLIEDSSRRVAEGVKIAAETRDALDLIVSNVIKVKDLVAEIATASTEQSRGVSQINVAMNQVAKAAQNGSQQAEELSASSSGLNDVAERIKTEIARFSLRPRQKAARSALMPGLENISPEMLLQIQQLLLKQKAAESAVPVRAQAESSEVSSASARTLSPKDILPLDKDERGFGSF